jgi:hypothetical protein
LFSPLKRALSNEIEKLFCLDTRRIPRTEWTKAYITARAKAFTSRNIESSLVFDRKCKFHSKYILEKPTFGRTAPPAMAEGELGRKMRVKENAREEMRKE